MNPKDGGNTLSIYAGQSVEFAYPSGTNLHNVDFLAMKPSSCTKRPAKSLTIANLVAHVVANGQSVMVSSHKNQALTVVRDKLESVGQRFLYASLIVRAIEGGREGCASPFPAMGRARS